MKSGASGFSSQRVGSKVDGLDQMLSSKIGEYEGWKARYGKGHTHVARPGVEEDCCADRDSLPLV